MKKKRILSLSLAAAMLFGSAAALPEGVFSEITNITASAVTDGDWDYVVLDDDTICLTKYNGGGGTVTVPSTFEGKDVVSFGTIFKGKTHIAKVIIPDTVTNIADNAFNNCKYLSSVTIGSGVTNIGDYAFYNCNALTSITFPNGLTNIGNYAFFDCYRIKSVAIPGSVKTIGDYAFARTNSYIYCGYTEPQHVTGYYHIKDGGAYYSGACMSIANVSLEEGLERIGSHSFYNCFNLKSVSIPKSVTFIDASAFGWTWYYSDGQPSYGWERSIKDFTMKCYKDSGAHVIYKPVFKYELLDVIKVEAKEPTCLEPGNIEYWVYNEDEYYTDNHATTMLDENEIVIPATGHQWSEWETISNPTCTTDGEKFRYCTACGKTEKPKDKKLGHDYSATVVDPTCTKDGYTEYKCSRCSDTYKDNFTTALGHNYVDTVVPPTCTAEGYTIHKCSHCGDEFKDSRTDATGHSWSDWKAVSFDTTNGTATQERTCSVCKAKETQTVSDAIVRFKGSGRYATAAAISQGAYPESAETVVLANGTKFADALAGATLANAYKAPILLTEANSLPADTLAEIKRLGAKNVIILGGSASVGQEVKDTLDENGLKFDIVKGKTKYATAVEIAKATKADPTEIFFVSADKFADALSVSAVAASKNAPIIYLPKTGSIDADTAAYLKSVKGKIKNAYVIGGSGVIGADVMAAAGKALGLTVDKTIVRVKGKTKYDTCVEVNTKFADVLNGTAICVATGEDFPDALAGGVYAAKESAPLFLVNGKASTPVLSDGQKTYLKTKATEKIAVFGGSGVVPNSHIGEIAENSL